MNHFISEAELLEMADLEDKLGCSLSAGLDWGDQIGEFLRQSYSHCFDSNKLAEVLTNDLGDIFSNSEI
jgi:hypothetical protein